MANSEGGSGVLLAPLRRPPNTGDAGDDVVFPVERRGPPRVLEAESERLMRRATGQWYTRPACVRR